MDNRNLQYLYNVIEHRIWLIDMKLLYNLPIVAGERFKFLRLIKLIKDENN